MSHICIAASIKSVISAAFALLFVLVLCGCGGGNSSPVPVNYHGDGTSGIRGVVTGYGAPIGTTPKPIANATVSAYAATSSGNSSHGAPATVGSLAAQTQTDAQGNYSLPLIPGSYVIGASSTIPPTSVEQRSGEATVSTHQFSETNIQINYGSP